jgi:cobaltochelatase CobS
MDEDLADKYGKFMGMIRHAASDDGQQVRGVQKHLSLDFSRRNLVDWIETTKAFAYLEAQRVCVPKYALGPVFTAGLPADEKATIEHLFDVAFGIEVE